MRENAIILYSKLLIYRVKLCINEKLLLMQTSLKVKFLSYGKRTSKYSIFLRRTGFNLSCWNSNYLSVCEIFTIEIFLPTLFTPIPSQYLLSLGRPSFISFLLYYRWDRTFRSFDYIEKQWTTSTTNWITQTSWHRVFQSMGQLWITLPICGAKLITNTPLQQFTFFMTTVSFP